MQRSIAPDPANGAVSARPRWSVPAISLETALYLIILVIACLTRFWDLGAGALHHDESMHAYYSWRYATGDNYIHNPLLHGPLLFHLTALTFLFLPDTDATARLMPAMFGVALVGLPWFLRGPRFLGRWGALAASFLLLISPSIFYYSRHLRHDLFTLTLTLLLFICIVRYLERPERRWLITGAAATALMLANHEVIFAILVLLFGYLYAVLAGERIITWWRDGRRSAAQLVLAAHGVALLGGLAALLLIPRAAREEILDIPWRSPTQQQQIDYYQKLATNELVIALLVVILGALAILITGLRRAGGSDAGVLGDAAPGSVAAGVRAVWRDPIGLSIALLTGTAIFVALFTTLFTNLRGLATSTIATDGTLLYWLGQHDVRRGEQPWFYFLTLAPQYELIAVFFGVGAALAIGVRALGAALKRWPPGPNLLMRGMLAVWFLGLFAGLSFAGEKMPWLVIHPTLPATLLAGLLIGGMIERAAPMLRNREISRPEQALIAGLLLTGAGWLAIAAMVTRNRIIQRPNDGIEQRVPTSWGLDHWWLLAIPPALGLLAIAALAVWRGPQRAALATAGTLVIGLSFVQVHAAWRMTYLEGDISRDMLIYTQTAPDITILMDDFEALSFQTYGDLSMPVYFGGDASWPMWWYLRDFPNRILAGSPADPAGVPENAAIYIVDSVSMGGARDQLDATFTGYTRYEYVLRWAFPETDTYRQFAIAPEISPARSAWGDPEKPHGPIDVLASIFDSIGHQLTPEGQQDLYRLIVYRDLTTPLTQWDTRIFVYVRNDLVPVFNAIRY